MNRRFNFKLNFITFDWYTFIKEEKGDPPLSDISCEIFSKIFWRRPSFSTWIRFSIIFWSTCEKISTLKVFPLLLACSEFFFIRPLAKWSSRADERMIDEAEKAARNKWWGIIKQCPMIQPTWSPWNKRLRFTLKHLGHSVLKVDFHPQISCGKNPMNIGIPRLPRSDWISPLLSPCGWMDSYRSKDW